MKPSSIIPHYDFLLEAAAPDVANLGIPRDEMPQIESDPETREKFFEYLRSKHIDVLDSMQPVKKLMPTQGEFNADKIDSLMKDFEPETNPVLVSSDAYLLDGHHRWAAAWNLDLDSMAVQVLDLKLSQALDVMRDYPDVFYKSVKEGAEMPSRLTKTSNEITETWKMTNEIQLNELYAGFKAKAETTELLGNAGESSQSVSEDIKTLDVLVKIKKKLQIKAGEASFNPAEKSAFQVAVAIVDKEIKQHGNSESVVSEARASGISWEVIDGNMYAIRTVETKPDGSSTVVYAPQHEGLVLDDLDGITRINIFVEKNPQGTATSVRIYTKDENGNETGVKEVPTFNAALSEVSRLIMQWQADGTVPDGMPNESASGDNDLKARMAALLDEGDRTETEESVEPDPTKDDVDEYGYPDDNTMHAYDRMKKVRKRGRDQYSSSHNYTGDWGIYEGVRKRLDESRRRPA